MTTEAATTASDILAMSDDEILNMEAPAIIAEEDTSTQNNPETNGVQTPDEEVDTPAVEDLPTEETSPEAEPDEDDSANSLTSDKVDDKVVDTEVDSNGKPITEAEPSTAEPGQEQKEEGKQSEGLPADFNYKEGYEKLMAPFKANGKVITPRSPEEAISLMQMGANYTRKMQELKPYRKVMLMLQNNGLMDEEKLSFLIDLDKKNPGAINKLVKDSGIDPLDIDAEKAGEYRPNTYRVDEREMALDTVLEEIQDTTTYTRTLGIVSKEWDGGSKQVIADNPELLKVINDHVARGVYDVIQAEMERERMFGRLSGLTDLEAYRQVGDAIQARGGFNHLASPQGGNQPGKPVGVVPQQKQPDDAKLKDKKRAASSTQSGVTSHSAEDFNPLALSDEEFTQLAKKRFQ